MAGFQIVNYESIIIKTVIAKNVKQNFVTTQPAHAHRSDVDNSSIFCGKHRRKRYRPDIGNGTRVFDIDIVVRCTYDEIQTTIFIREPHMKYMLTMSNYI